MAAGASFPARAARCAPAGGDQEGPRRNAEPRMRGKGGAAQLKATFSWASWLASSSWMVLRASDKLVGAMFAPAPDKLLLAETGRAAAPAALS